MTIRDATVRERVLLAKPIAIPYLPTRRVEIGDRRVPGAGCHWQLAASVISHAIMHKPLADEPTVAHNDPGRLGLSIRYSLFDIRYFLYEHE